MPVPGESFEHTLMAGAPGVGKTHLATALGHIAIRRRLSVHMARAGQMFKKLKAARLNNTTEAEHRRLATASILIIDDFALTPLDETATADFYELTVARHRKNPTIVTSNRTPDEWVTLMSDPLLAQSAVDRLTQLLERVQKRRLEPYAAASFTSTSTLPDLHG